MSYVIMLSLPDFEKKQWIMVFSHQGEKVSVKNDNIVILDEDKKIIYQSSCYRLFCLMILGPTILTSGVIERSKKFGFSIFLMNTNFRVYESLLAENRGNYLLREKQYQNHYFPIAQTIISNKIENQLYLLKNIRNKKENIHEVIQNLKNYIKNIEGLENDFDSLLGYEGMGSRMFFQNYFEDIGWKRRSPRTKEDIPNLLLDIGYTYLFNLIESLLVLYGFDVYKGVYHQPFYQRKSLVCDLVEPFRPMVDRILKNAFALKQIDEGDFEIKNHQYFLPYKNNKKYSKIFIEGIGEYRLEMFRYVQSYYRAFIKGKSLEAYPKFVLN